MVLLRRNKLNTWYGYEGTHSASLKFLRSPYHILAGVRAKQNGGADGNRTRDSALRTLRNPALLQPLFLVIF